MGVSDYACCASSAPAAPHRLRLMRLLGDMNCVFGRLDIVQGLNTIFYICDHMLRGCTKRTVKPFIWINRLHPDTEEPLAMQELGSRICSLKRFFSNLPPS